MALTDKQRTPPKSAQNNAKKALRWRKEHPKETEGAGTRVGWTRARQLADGGPLSEDVIKRMAQFNRHRQNAEVDPKYKDEPWRDKGYLMWMAWGGTTGIDWAIMRAEMMGDKISGVDMNTKKMVVPFAVKQIDEDDDFYTFEGYGSTFDNVDLGDDRVMRGAFKESIRECMESGKMPPVLWQHDMHMPLGKYIEMREDERGLYVKGRMPKADDFVRGRVYPQMKAGSVGAMSIGYRADEWEIEDGIRNLKKLKLFEISLVTMPMNPQAEVTGIKAVVPFQDLPLAEVDHEWDSDAAMPRVRELLDSEDEPSSRYRRAFLWYDRENADEFGAYKLPIADVIDGRLVAVPRAIFAAAAAVQGARGGVDIPESDMGGVRRNIERYYDKMDRESPFDGKSLIIDADMLKCLSERQIDRVLRSGVRMTRKATKNFIACLDAKSLRDADGCGAREAKSDTLDWAEVMESLNEIKTNLED